MKINTKLDVGSRLYTIINQNSTSVIGFLIVKSIKVEVSEYDNKITYDLSNGVKVDESDLTEENNYYLKADSAAKHL